MNYFFSKILFTLTNSFMVLHNFCCCFSWKIIAKNTFSEPQSDSASYLFQIVCVPNCVCSIVCQFLQIFSLLHFATYSYKCRKSERQQSLSLRKVFLFQSNLHQNFACKFSCCINTRWNLWEAIPVCQVTHINVTNIFFG